MLALSLVSGLFTHGYNLFQYPLFLTDEGIYVEQAWSLANEGRLSPYTYFYDHAPAGWMVIAAWDKLLPGGFHAFDNEINAVRVLMLLVHVASVGLLFGIVRKFSGSAAGAFVAAFIFNFSPLAVYYQRQVLLDNLMVFWLLLAVYLLARTEGRVMTAMLSDCSSGYPLSPRRTRYSSLPALAYMVHRGAAGQRNRRFVTIAWWVAMAVPVGAYVLFALLKNELFPTGLNFDRDNPPADHVSLLYSIWWQLNRTGAGGFQAMLRRQLAAEGPLSAHRRKPGCLGRAMAMVAGPPRPARLSRGRAARAWVTPSTFPEAASCLTSMSRRWCRCSP